MQLAHVYLNLLGNDSVEGFGPPHHASSLPTPA